MKDNKIFWLVLIVGVLFLTGVIKMPEGIIPSTAPSVPGAAVVPMYEASPGRSSTLFFSTEDGYTADHLSAGINHEVWGNEGTQWLTETVIDANPDSVGSMPNTLNGYIMLGNDNYVSGTDRGNEIYYVKHPFSYVNKGEHHAGEIKYYNESTPTWTGYDDGTLEATTSIAVGSGATVTSTELKIAASADTCLGNPAFSRPLAVCFNATDHTNHSKVDEVRPTTYDSTVGVPSFLSGSAIIGSSCYVLPTEAVCDYGEHRFFIVIKMKSGQDPAAGESLNAILLDKTYYKDDNGMWQVGWAYDSDMTTDTDIGMQSLVANTKQIQMT